MGRRKPQFAEAPFRTRSEKIQIKAHDGTADADANSNFHLVLHSHPNRSNMLSCITLESHEPDSEEDPELRTTIGRRIKPMKFFGIW